MLLLLVLVAVTAAGQERVAVPGLRLPASAPVAQAYSVEPAFWDATFEAPIGIVAQPDRSDLIYIVEQGGRVLRLDLDAKTSSVFLDLAAILAVQPGSATSLLFAGECGLLGMAFHPNFKENGFLFLFHSCNISSSESGTLELHQRVVRLKAIKRDGSFSDAITVDPASYTPLITQRDEDGNHNGGDLQFGPDGYLYVSVGDEGAYGDLRDNSRHIAKDFFGGILRLDVDLSPASLNPNPHEQPNSSTHPSAIHPGTYKVPASNPFVSLPVDPDGMCTYGEDRFPRQKVRTELWAIGLRNPWRMSFDHLTGRLFVADVGEALREEINIVHSGFNGGWSWREGDLPHQPASPPWTPPPGLQLSAPIYSYAHRTTAPTEYEGECVIGGILYRGSRLGELAGTYIFGDYLSGHIWALRNVPNGWSAEKLLTLPTGLLLAFGRDPRNGDVLFAGHGRIWRLVRSFAGDPAPATLSATGAFSDLQSLTPEPGILPYEVNLPFWSDHAAKRRWFAIPRTQDKMGFATHLPWAFPTGQVWIKHFEIDLTKGGEVERKRLETRFLVKTESGVYGLTYKWRADGSDADLVGDAGFEETLPVPVNGEATEQVWRYPSRSECLSCHTQAGGYALGFDTRQLNRILPGSNVNQLSLLRNMGYFDGSLPPVSTLPAHPALDNGEVSREARVRAYLAVNCSYCHQPGFLGGNWDGRATTKTDDAGIVDGTLRNDGGDPANRFVVAGDLLRSVGWQRMMALEPSQRMPPIGRHTVDSSAVQLFADWITEDLPARENLAAWQERYFSSSTGSEGDPESDPDADGRSNAVEFLLRTNPWSLDAGPICAVEPNANGMARIRFSHPANRSAVIETSTDLTNWSLWDVPGNRPFHPAETHERIFEVQPDAQSRFFRLRIEDL